MTTNWRRLGVFAAVLAVAVVGFRLTRSHATPEDTGRVLARLTHADGTRSVTLLSQPYRLDKVYMSMIGPRSSLRSPMKRRGIRGKWKAMWNSSPSPK